MARILVLHGPNLNMLGKREPSIYGSTTLSALNALLKQEAKQGGHEMTAFQSNSEAGLIDFVQKEGKGYKFILVNAAALTHTSIALRDALKMIEIPFIEVHITNIYARETFRHFSYLSDIAEGVVCGLGIDGYLFALRYAMKQLD